MQVTACVLLLLGAGGWSIVRALHRAPASVALARSMMSRGPVTSGSFRDRFTEGALADRAGRHFGSGLEVIDSTPADVVSRVLGASAILTLAVGGSVAALTAMGMLPLSVPWLVVPPAAGALAGWVTFREVGSKIDRRRRELRQAANDFIQLVAVGLTTDQSVEEAVRFALDVGSTDAFDALRYQVLTAPQRGVAVWDAIDEFGRRYGVRELGEFAGSVERQGMQGVSISETVTALATAMRAASLDELEREADRANANLSGPTIGFVVATIVFLAYPLAQRISDAFGG
jgi:Flp pilus assembly protein TadB